ncbi:Copper homeostasis protein cutC [Emticicia oligotrophica DSM 17448]|uniref:PF03932 family protein CutC n=1 Tax=Emticicia oligotrophica (strain DSM 17448 / CIP 109782 / MTCC 6937 / GPTSA100-15) TaxID=929562 RepID=A0ABM5N0F3_EMTOG|nr:MULTISPECIES: copper homeostasis protein CutC [Emticicia]AFK02837.1 Copper homeostasis protein cutC [Emticicia oligotrophica DSM 17448]
MLEICSFSLESCLTAQNAGAGRVELCGGMFEGGTTPSAGLIRLARKHLHVKLYVMIRPRGGDFCYSDAEFAVMKEDIQTAKDLGADGVVFGILNPDGSIDQIRTSELVRLAAPLKVTFHRAFDVANNPIQALEDIIACGCERILTSGQKNTAIEGIDLLKTLVEKSQNRIEIMAGSGVSAQNAQQFLSVGVRALHMTGKGIQESKMIFRKPDVSMASAALSNEFEIYEADFEKCKAVAALLPA